MQNVIGLMGGKGGRVEGGKCKSDILEAKPFARKPYIQLDMPNYIEINCITRYGLYEK